jgi:hypothetical protein
MAAITWTMVEAFAAELSTVPASAQTDILDYVNETLAVDHFGGEDSINTKLARIYLAAHHGTITKNGSNGPAGPLLSQSTADLSRTYAAFSPAGSDALLDTTPYGKAFRSMVRRSTARCPVVL